MNTARLSKLAPLSGIIMVVLWIFGLILVTAEFGYTITRNEALDGLSENPARIQAGTLLAGFYSVVFLIGFAGSVSSALRDAETEGGRLAAIAFGGALVAGIALASGYAILWVAATRAGRPGSVTAEYAVIMNDLYSARLANVLSVGLAAFTGTTGIISLRTRLFPAWLGWVSVVFGVGLLTPMHWVFEGLATAWIVVVSIQLYRRDRQASVS